jgi:hypothetical protein
MRFSVTFPLASMIVALLAIDSPSQAQEGTRNGALLGGAAGAVIGGIVGNNKNDQTAEGALIGGAVGAVAGGWIGHHRDKVTAEQQRRAQATHYYPHPNYSVPRGYYPPRYPHPHYPGYPPGFAGPGQPTIVSSAPVVTRQGVYRSPSRVGSGPVRQPVTMSDVIHMTRSGVSDPVIVSRIQTNGMAQSPSVDDVIMLSQQGVSDAVISAMQGDGGTQILMEPSSELMPVPPLRNQRRGF